MAGGDPFPRAAGRSRLARAGRARGRRSGGGRAHHRAGRARRLGARKAWPVCSRCAPAASSCTARMTAPASSPTTSASRSRPRLPSAPATTAPPAAACWRSMIWPSGGGRAACSTSAPAPACWRSRRRKCCAARVVASDIDRVAVDAARANARLNRAAPAITFVRAAGANARAIASGAPYDLIFANILLGPLMRLAVPLSRLAAPRRAHRALRPVAGSRQCRARDLSRAGLRARAAHSRSRLGHAGASARRRCQNKTAPGGDDRGGFAGEKLNAYQPPNGMSPESVLTSRLPRSSKRVGQQLGVHPDFAARLLHARLDQRIHHAGEPALARRRCSARAPWRQARRRQRAQRHK